MIRVKQKWSKNQKARAREGGASVFTAMLSFFSVPPSFRPKVLGAKPKQAGKKEWGFGPLRRSFSEARMNSAFLLPNQNETSPATLQFIARHHRKILFSLGEKEIRRAQNEKSKEYFSVVWRACRAVAGLASLVGGLLKECSNFVQKTPPRITFRKIKVGCLGASRRGNFLQFF